MTKYMSLAILIIVAGVSDASSLFGIPSTPPDFPDIYSMIMTMLAGIQAPLDEFGHELKYDKLTSTWTANCSSTEDCKFGVDFGDLDTCPQCLLGPGETCDSWSADCGDKMLCVFPGPMECSGNCVLEEEFNSRAIGETCSEFIGQCKDGLHCKYDEEASFLLPVYGSLTPHSGECVDEETFNSRTEGESCGDSVGGCSDGLVCRGSMLPWTPHFCVDADNDRTLSQFSPLSSMEDIFGPPDEIDIVLFDEENEDQAMVDVLDLIENIFPGMDVDPESDDVEIIFSENEDSSDEKNVTGHVDVEVIVHSGKHKSEMTDLKVVDDEFDEGIVVLDIESPKEVSRLDKESGELKNTENVEDVLVLDIETPRIDIKEDDRNFDFEVDDSVIVPDLMKPLGAKSGEEMGVFEIFKDDLSALSQDEDVFEDF